MNDRHFSCRLTKDKEKKWVSHIFNDDFKLGVGVLCPSLINIYMPIDSIDHFYSKKAMNYLVGKRFY